MMRRIAYVFLTLLVISIAGIYWLTTTQSGLDFVLKQAQQQLPELSVESGEGQLAGRLKLKNIQYKADSGMQVELQSLDLDWLPWALLSGQLLMNQLHLSGLELTAAQEDETTEKPDTSLPEIAVPISISIRSLRVNDAWLNGVDGSRTLLFDRLDTRMRVSQDRLVISDLNLNRPELAFMLSGETRLSAPYPVNLNYGLTFYPPDIKPLRVTGTVDGDWRRLNVHQQVGEPLASQQDITLSNILENLTWRLESNSQMWELADLNAAEDSRLLGMRVSAGGDLERADIVISGVLEHQDYPPVSLLARFETDDFNNWQLDSDFHITEEKFVSLDGAVNSVTTTPQADLKLRWHNLTWPLETIDEPDVLSSGVMQLAVDMDNFTAGLEASLEAYQETVSLSGRLAGNTRALDINSLNIGHREGDIKINGQLALGNAFQYAVNAQWNELQVPEQFSELSVTSTRGNLQLDGENDLFSLRARGDLTLDNLPLTVDVRANSEESGLADIQLDASSGPGEARVSGNVDWRHDLAASATMQFEQIDPSVLLQDWPGNLAGGLDIKVSESANKPTAIHISDLHIYGDLLRKPVDVKANLNYQENLSLDNLNVKSADSSFSAQGTIGDELALGFEVDAPSLSDFHPSLAGRLTGSGALSGRTTEPTLSLNLSGDNIRYAETIQLTKLSADGQISAQQSQKSDLQLSLSNLQVADYTLGQLAMTIDGQPAQHDIQLQGENKQLTFNTRLTGGWDGKQWRGKLNQLNLEEETAGNWQLTQPASLQLGAQSQALSDFCWQSTKNEQLCLDLLAYEKQHWQILANLTEMDISRLNAFTEDYVDMSGALNAELAMQKAEGPPIGKADIDINSLTVMPTANNQADQEPIRFKQFSMQADFEENASRFALTVAPDLDGFEPLRATASSADLATLLAEPRDTELSAQFQSRIDKLSALAFISPAFEELQGELAFDADVSGTVNQPSADARLSLRQGQVAVQQLGIVLKSLEADIDGNLNDGISFLYRAQSGDGTLEGEGDFTLSDQGWQMQTTVVGDNVEVVHLPEAYVVASPDLKLSISPGNASLTGDLVIPEAELAPLEFNSSVSPSNDVEIVGAPEKDSDTLATDVDIRVVLGEQVRITGLGFKGRLTGDLAVRGDAGELLTGNGVITVTDGIYEAYGQKLTVDNGKIRFSGAAIDNPELDIRAVRTGRDFTAGLHIQGPAASPQATLFSNPSMSQDNILSHILLGRGINSASGDDAAMLASAATSLGIRNGNMLGQEIASTFALDEFRLSGDGADNAALQIGKYLSPKLYLGYGIGVFEPVSTVQLRYKLNQIWSLQAESGTESGVDLLYIFER